MPLMRCLHQILVIFTLTVGVAYSMAVTFNLSLAYFTICLRLE